MPDDDGCAGNRGERGLWRRPRFDSTQRIESISSPSPS